MRHPGRPMRAPRRPFPSRVNFRLAQDSNLWRYSSYKIWNDFDNAVGLDVFDGEFDVRP